MEGGRQKGRDEDPDVPLFNRSKSFWATVEKEHDVEANMHPEEHYRSGSSYESEQSKNQDDGIQLKEEKPCRSAEAQRIHFGRVRMPV